MWQGPSSFIGPSQGLARRRAEARFLHQRGLSFAIHVPYLWSTFEQVKPFHCFGLSLKNTSIRRIWRSQHRQPVAVISKWSEMWSLMTYFWLFLYFFLICSCCPLCLRILTSEWTTHGCGKTWQIRRSLYLFHITLVALRQSCRRRRMEERLPRGLRFSRSLPCLNISKRKPWKENYWYIQLHGRTLHWNQSHWAEFIFESLTRQVRTAFYFRSLQGRNSSRVICYDLLVCALSPCFASPESSCWGSPGSAWLFPRFEDRRCTQGTTARYGKHSNT